MKRTGLGRLFAGVAVISLALAACSSGTGASAAPSGSAAAGGATCQGAGDKGTVKLMINQWVGAQANVAVVECLLKQIGYKVETNTLAEEVAWQGFDTGEVDVILEN
jgi:glycine betaine/proline transport system substrate-binding protein